MAAFRIWDCGFMRVGGEPGNTLVYVLVGCFFSFDTLERVLKFGSMREGVRTKNACYYSSVFYQSSRTRIGVIVLGYTEY